MINTNELRRGMFIELDKDVFEIVEFQHIKPGKGGAFVRVKVKNLKTGRVIERTLNAGVKIPLADIAQKDMQYMYKDGENYVFMDTETYDQIAVNSGQIGDGVKYLKENTVVTCFLYNGIVLTIKLPALITLKVIETVPGVRGDTVQGASKPAKLETGVEIQVPLFIEKGEEIKVDTRTGEYAERV